MPGRADRGFTLAGLIAILTVMMVVVAYTVPRQWSMVLQRERDHQTLFVMKQYARAIRKWQNRYGGLPTSLEQLESARPRILRGSGLMNDPVTGKADWLLIPPVPAGADRPPVASNASGPFIGVRPRRTGPSFIAPAGARRYEEWSYTVADLEREIAQRTARPR